MRYIRTHKFKEDYKGLSTATQEKARKQFRLFKSDSSHPSLQIHRIRGSKNPPKYEGYVDRRHRFTFHREPDTIVFRRIGPHSIIEEEARA